MPPAAGIRYDGADAAALRDRLALPRVELLEHVSSTMDVAHDLAAAGAPAGTLVLADRQTAGRGRAGRRWASASGAGIWLTLVERPSDLAALDVLSLRLGLHAARALDPWAGEPLRLKWPNDLYLAAGKLGGILVETRWRGARPDWVAVGIGINVRPPDDLPAAALRPGADRGAVLGALVPALRAAAAARGPLGAAELAAWNARDLALGRPCRAPASGVVAGIDARGALIVHTAAGDVACRSGSLVFQEDA